MESSYELRFSEVTHHTESQGYISRQADATTRMWLANATPAQQSACHEAGRLVQQNEPGDRDRAIALLSGVYSQVELDLSMTPATDPTEPGLVIPGQDADVLVKTDGTVWRKFPHGEWSQEPIDADVGRQIYQALKRQQAKVGWLKRRLPDHQRDSLRDVNYGIYTPSELLELVHGEAKARLFATAPAIASKYREVTDVEGDHFDLIIEETGLPVPIRSREDLEQHLPLVTHT